MTSKYDQFVATNLAIEAVIFAAKNLTVMGKTPGDCPAKGYAGGQMIIGSVGWEQLQTALRKLSAE